MSEHPSDINNDVDVTIVYTCTFEWEVEWKKQLIKSCNKGKIWQKEWMNFAHK